MGLLLTPSLFVHVLANANLDDRMESTALVKLYQTTPFAAVLIQSSVPQETASDAAIMLVIKGARQLGNGKPLLEVLFLCYTR